MRMSIATPIALVTLPMLASCSLIHFSRNKNAAEAAVEQFRSDYSAGKYHEIYAHADQQFKDADTEAHFAALLDAEQRKLGVVQNSGDHSVSVTTSTGDDTMVTLIYATQFQKGTGKETFDFRIKDGEAILDGYHIESLALVTK